jgi:hypothetical protein
MDSQQHDDDDNQFDSYLFANSTAQWQITK